MKRIMIFAMALAALASCSENEQSELNFSDIQGTATIQGQVTYNNGFRTDNGAIVSSDVPAANIPVIAKVDYDNFSSKAEGTKIIEVTTDAEGKYSITIPCGQKPVEVELQPRGFNATYSKLLDGGKTVELKAYYEPKTPKKVSVVMGDNKTENFFNVDQQSLESVTSRSQQVKFSGKIELTKPSDYKLEAGEGTKVTKATDVTIVLKSTALLPNGQKDTREVVASAKETSNYDITVALFDDWDVTKVEYTLTVAGFPFNYLNTGDESKQGYYESIEKAGNLTAVSLKVGVKNDFMFGMPSSTEWQEFK